MGRPENWEKPRDRGTHFSLEEITFLREAYDAGEEDTEKLARQLKCARRTVNAWFSRFRAGLRPGAIADRPSRVAGATEVLTFIGQKERKPIPAPNAMPWCLGRLTGRRA